MFSIVILLLLAVFQGAQISDMNRTSIFFGINFDADIDAALVYHLPTNSGRTLYL